MTAGAPASRGVAAFATRPRRSSPPRRRRSRARGRPTASTTVSRTSRRSAALRLARLAHRAGGDEAVDAGVEQVRDVGRAGRRRRPRPSAVNGVMTAGMMPGKCMAGSRVSRASCSGARGRCAGRRAGAAASGSPSAIAATMRRCSASCRAVRPGTAIESSRRRCHSGWSISAARWSAIAGQDRVAGQRRRAGGGSGGRRRSSAARLAGVGRVGGGLHRGSSSARPRRRRARAALGGERGDLRARGCARASRRAAGLASCGQGRSAGAAAARRRPAADEGARAAARLDRRPGPGAPRSPRGPRRGRPPSRRRASRSAGSRSPGARRRERISPDELVGDLLVALPDPQRRDGPDWVWSDKWSCHQTSRYTRMCHDLQGRRSPHRRDRARSYDEATTDEVAAAVAPRPRPHRSARSPTATRAPRCCAAPPPACAPPATRSSPLPRRETGLPEAAPARRARAHRRPARGVRRVRRGGRLRRGDHRHARPGREADPAPRRAPHARADRPRRRLRRLELPARVQHRGRRHRERARRRLPVVVKGHPSHPGTSELVAAELRRRGRRRRPAGRDVRAPAGRLGIEVGAGARRRARRSGRRLHGLLRAAAARSSTAPPRGPSRSPSSPRWARVNPIVVTEAALAARADAIAEGLVGVGRELRRPAVHEAGRRLRPRGRGGRRVRGRRRRAARAPPSRPVLLNERLATRCATRSGRLEDAGCERLAAATRPAVPASAIAERLPRGGGATVAARPELLEEHFGPVVAARHLRLARRRCCAALERIDGQLTAPCTPRPARTSRSRRCQALRRRAPAA